MTNPGFHLATGTDDALAALADAGPSGTVLAGGTWVMRAPIRGGRIDRFYVAIGQIEQLRTVQVTEREIQLGACLTHADIARELAGIGQANGLCMAALGAANPSIRQMATLGGNIAAWDFPASDLSPALLCLDAHVELQSTGGVERLPIARFLDNRRDILGQVLVTGVTFPRLPHRTGHARLPLRKAGDYPVATVSMALDTDDGGRISHLRIAVGSVEAAPRRWLELEDALRGQLLDADVAHDVAKQWTSAFTGRESVEAPAWYRVAVLPALVRRATLAAAARQ